MPQSILKIALLNGSACLDPVDVSPWKLPTYRWAKCDGLTETCCYMGFVTVLRASKAMLGLVSSF